MQYFILLASVVNLILAFLILAKCRRLNIAQKSFFWFLVITAIWSFVNYLLLLHPGSIFILRASYAFGALVATSAVIWIMHFTGKTKSIIIDLALVVSGIFFFVISYFPFGVVRRLILLSDGTYRFESGVLHIAFIVFVAAMIALICWALVSYFLIAKGIFHEQAKYVLGGAIIFSGGEMISNVIYPILGLRPVTYWDGVLSLFFTIPAAYAMVRYRFMDVRIVLRKGTVYAITIVIALGIYSYLAFIGARTAEQLFGYQSVFSNFIAVILIAIGFHPLRRMVEYVLNTYFFPKRMDLRVISKRIALQLSSTVSGIEDILKTIRKETGPALGVESIDLFFQKEQGIWGEVQPSINPAISINPQTPLFQYIVKNKNILITEEIEFQINESNNPEEIEALENIKLFLSKHNIAAVVPVFQEYEDLIGILFLGSKINQSAYTIEDIQFLKNLQQNLPLSMSGIILYYQAMKRVEVQMKK